MSDETPLVAGRYRLDELIGRGGMGDVYRGTDTPTGQPIAVKQLHAAILEENPDIVDRFTREGEALRQLNHPNIVKVLETLEENGQHYLVMEYVSGGSLRDLIDEQGRVPMEAVLNVALDLADALTRAHRLNIIHRDIKPDNVLLAEDGTPRLTDFGVAHLGDRTRLTQTGSVIGTYAYLSPEACNGLELDARTDIWSFGVMLFEMLTGRLPFQEASTGAILTAILTKPAPDLDRLRPGLPRPLVDLITRMLEKDRERRVGSVRVIGAELEAIINGMDTPLRSLVRGSREKQESRFATPSDQGFADVPAMVRSTPEQTHGFSLFPGGAAGRGSGTPPPDGTPQFTPGGTPITGEYARVSSQWKWISLMVIVTVMACSIVAVIAILLGPETGKSDENSVPPTATVPLDVEAVAPGEYMVLVAQMEPLGGVTPRDVSRFIVDDLTQTIEIGVPFSKARVRSYPAVITSQEDAQRVAAAHGATVIIWGNYTPDRVELEVGIGTTSAFSHITFAPEVLTRTANVRVRLTDERTQSVAPDVLDVLATLQGADGTLYEFMRTLAVMAETQVTPAEIAGDSVAAHVHRYFASYASDTDEALRAIDGAIDKDATNAFLYALRSLALEHQGRTDDARRAADTAQRLGPQGWSVPLALLAITADTPEHAIALYDEIVAQRPDDWFSLSSRGALYYHQGDLERARADFDAAIALQPDANFPYALSALVAIAEGRFPDAASAIQVIFENYPDPDLYSRIVGAALGGHDSFGPIISTFINVSLGRYEQAIVSADTGLERIGPAADLLTMQGIAYCNLSNYEAAEQAYSQVIDAEQPISSLVGFVALLRAEVRLKQDDVSGARDDFATATSSGMLAPDLIDAFKAGQVGCTTLFGTPVMIEATPAPTAAPATPVSSAATPEASVTPETAVEPVQPGEVLVLVAELENLAGIGQIVDPQRRDMTRLVVNDLQETLETAVPFSNLRVRRYPQVIRGDDEAQAAATQTGAAVIVWGNYTDDLIEIEVQVGALSGFPYNRFAPSVIERTANVRVHLTDARRESVAPYVLNVINLLYLADGNGYEALRVGAIQDALDAVPGELVGSSVAAQTQRALLASGSTALNALSSALALDAGNGLLYVLQSIVDQRAGDVEAARRDAQTAQRVGPAGWTMPQLLLANLTRDDSVLGLFDQLIAARPDDWFPLFFRGAIYYSLHGMLPDAYTLARADLDAAIALRPNANFPYVYAALLALHEGRLQDAWALIDTILTEFPDPGFMERLVRSTFGDSGPNPYIMTMSAFANYTLGQQAQVLTNTAEGIAAFPGMSDFYLLRGLAYCALNQDADALRSLNSALVRDPGLGLARLLRASLFLQLDRPDDAARDFATLAQGSQADRLAPYVDAVRAGQVTCSTLLSASDPLLVEAAASRATASATPTPVTDAAYWAVEPVEPGETMVLVADLEPLGGVAPRDVARFVADNLGRTLENELPYTHVRVRRYPDVVTSAEQARAVAEAAGAAVVVWGNYTPDVIELEVQLGSTKKFPYILFARDQLDATANVRVQLTDERRESVAGPVLDLINLLYLADGDEFHFVLTLMLIDTLDVTDGRIVGSGVPAHLHRALTVYREDPVQSVDEFSQALTFDSGNPLLYAYRGIARIRTDANNAAFADLRTAGRIGPEGWAIPIYISDTGTPDLAIEAYSQVIALRPNDWFAYFQRGIVRYLDKGDLAGAKIDLEQAIALEPDANLPYITTLMIALREGRITDAQTLARTVLTEFPDPELTNRVFAALYGSVEASQISGAYFAAVANLILGQYGRVATDLDGVLAALFSAPAVPGLLGEQNVALSDLFLLQGLALCSLDRALDARTAFGQSIKFSRDYALPYLLRGQMYLSSANRPAANQDFQAARDHSPDPVFTPWIDAAVAGTWTCQNFLDYVPPEP